MIRLRFACRKGLKMVMSRFLWLLALAGIAGGVWYVVRQFDAQIERGKDGQVERITLEPKGGLLPPVLPGTASGRADRPAPGTKTTIRIASFHLDRLDDHKFARPVVSDLLVNLVPQFDLWAFQELGGGTPSVLLRLLERVNEGGRHYDFAVCPSVREKPTEQYLAFVFNRATIEVDVDTVRTIEDPTNQFRRKPLVGLFRVRGPRPDEAFTFKLVNVQVDPAYADNELPRLAEVYRAVRDDGLGEDDVILAGNFVAVARKLDAVFEPLRLTACIADPLNGGGSSTTNNLVISRRATNEFTGRGGVFDLVRAYDLNPLTLQAISPNLPVWAEFTAFEGGTPGFVP